MINISKSTKIYIACPAGIATGGPELLHQLAFNLKREFSTDVYMFYYPTKIKNSTHPDYKKYNVSFCQEVEDSKKNVLVVPEVQPACFYLNKYKNIRKVVWFLSVDNYFLSRPIKYFLFKRIINKILQKLDIFPLFDIEKNINKIDSINDPLFKDIILYLTNSYRGFYFLQKRNFSPLMYLSEYLNENFLTTPVKLEEKLDIVAYNPKKGLAFTKKIIKMAPHLKFVPLENMSRQEVIKTLKKAKVYIDFGNHPGKDRLPREAAILFCCIITNKQGSAGFYKDIPIFEEYKFNNNYNEIKSIVNKIDDCINHYSEKINDFHGYREEIKKEPDEFITDLKKIFYYKNN
jgi:hypothetical protein